MYEEQMLSDISYKNEQEFELKIESKIPLLLEKLHGLSAEEVKSIIVTLGQNMYDEEGSDTLPEFLFDAKKADEIMDYLITNCPNDLDHAGFKKWLEWDVVAKGDLEQFYFKFS